MGHRLKKLSMSKVNSSEAQRLRVEILVPIGETVPVRSLSEWLRRTSPRASLVVEELSFPSFFASSESSSGSVSSTSISVGSTSSEENYQRRARAHVDNEATEASVTSLLAEVDINESEPDGETIGSNDSTRSPDSGTDDLSFISHSESFRDIQNVREWIARNDEQDRKRLRDPSPVLLSPEEYLASADEGSTRIVVDLTDERPIKRTRFE